MSWSGIYQIYHTCGKVQGLDEKLCCMVQAEPPKPNICKIIKRISRTRPPLTVTIAIDDVEVESNDRFVWPLD